MKTICPTAAPGDAGKPGGEHFDVLALLVEAGHEEVVELVGLDAEDGFFLRDQAFFHHLDGDANRGAPGALAVARLQHVQAAVLDGELEVLHVAIVLFQPRGDLAQLVVDVGLIFSSSEMWTGVRMPATTSSPCAFIRNSP